MKKIIYLLILFTSLCSCSSNYKDKVMTIVDLAQTNEALPKSTIKKILSLHHEVKDSVFCSKDTTFILSYSNLISSILEESFYSFGDTLALKEEVNILEKSVQLTTDVNDAMRVSSELIEAYANLGLFMEAERLAITQVEYVESEFGYASLNMGTLTYLMAYIMEKEGNLDMTLQFYEDASNIYKEVIALGQKFLSNPDLTAEQIEQFKSGINEANEGLKDCEIAIKKAPSECAKNLDKNINPKKEHSNKWFSIKYPKNWEVYEERNEISDSIPQMKEGLSVYVTPTLARSPNTPSVYIVKSSMIDIFSTPEGWRDLSIQLKASEDAEYKTLSIADSIDFNGNPAALAVFQVVTPETKDTIIQIQYSILRENKDLFYVNNQFYPNDTLNMNLGWDIIKSIQFK